MRDAEETLPCGCIVGTTLFKGVKTFFIKPCSETCKYYAYAITESRKQGKPIDHREVL